MTGRDECRLPACDRAPGEQAREDYRDGRFCSIQHETKFDHLKADARDAREADREAAAEVRHR